MKSLKEIFKQSKSKNLKSFSDICAEKLIKREYIYNNVFGWEKKEIIESFALNPNMKGVPCVLQPKWVEKKVSHINDTYGNKIKIEPKIEWIRSQTEKEWYPNENWLAYQQFKKDRWIGYNKQKFAHKINTPPIECYNQ